MRYLGIDYGAKRVGMALSDEGGKVAFPHSVLKNDASLLKDVARIVEEQKVELVVIGESKDLEGKENRIARSAARFKKELEAALGKKVEYEPEFWSSMQAERWQGKTDKLDASAAAIILQSFLDKHNSKTR
ncbi:MAG: putative holliday junction resolvase [Parcubacteria group bacterium Gr01-1014_17]|nr:MAG: putative holliday junction resolvase [Parcubacteria group bacterium Gr01-1014_17]